MKVFSAVMSWFLLFRRAWFQRLSPTYLSLALRYAPA
jgi:hypothetical protein